MPDGALVDADEFGRWRGEADRALLSARAQREGGCTTIQALDDRRAERARLIERARGYVELLGSRLELRAAAIAGSAARGDFNVWSDVDVLVVADGLPWRAPDRAWLLLEGAPPRVQPIGYTLAELEREWLKGNRLVCEAVEQGLPLVGAEVFEQLRGQPAARPGRGGSRR
jgi:hypothetical protein